MSHVECFLRDSLSDADDQACRDLNALIWPPEVVRQTRAGQSPSAPAPAAGDDAQRARVWLIRDDAGDIIGKTMVTPRLIETQRGRLVVAALGGVCVHPDHRGKGYGRDLVLTAFETVDSGIFEVSFFQTAVRAFYEALGARRVDNPLRNSLADDPEVHPFWEQVAMIYPACYDWPEGVVDTLGPGW